MKKNILISFLFLTVTPYFCFSKNQTVQSMQVSFFSAPNKKAQASAQSEPDVDYWIDILQQFAELQKKRRLTLEEIMVVLQVMFFLFNNADEDHSKRIEILLNGKDKITVPYSSQIFASLNQQNTENNPSNIE